MRRDQKRSTEGKAAARFTASGPRKGPGNGKGNANGKPATRKARDTDALAAAFPFNASKPGEIGEASRTPKAGATAEPADRSMTGSTLTEGTTSPKAGTQARAGANPGNESLDRVRVDSGGRMLTTNFGQPIADNQNSLK
jgi:catalase